MPGFPVTPGPSVWSHIQAFLDFHPSMLIYAQDLCPCCSLFRKCYPDPVSTGYASVSFYTQWILFSVPSGIPCLWIGVFHEFSLKACPHERGLPSVILLFPVILLFLWPSFLQVYISHLADFHSKTCEFPSRSLLLCAVSISL